MGDDGNSKNRTFDRLAVMRKFPYNLFPHKEKNDEFFLAVDHVCCSATTYHFQKDFPSLFVHLLFIHDEKIFLHCHKVRRCEYQITRWKYCFVYLTKGNFYVRWMICIVFVSAYIIWKENKHTYSSGWACEQGKKQKGALLLRFVQP